MKWENTLGSEWYELLSSFVEGKEMLKIANSIRIARKSSVVYPSKEEFWKIFRIFKELQPSDIKVIILGQDPYPNGNGTGYAFDNVNILPSAINPSLKNFLEEIENNDVKKDQSFPLDLMNLDRLVQQGIFLVNSYLTVEKDNAGKHKFWDSFTRFWIKALSNYKTDIIYLLMGNFAQSYEDCIYNDINTYTIRTSHPSPFSYTTETKKAKAFKGSKCFEEINNHLWILDKETIKW